MEYPMATLVTGNRSFESLLGVTVHEMIHSWYQGVLATDESIFPWMDEGFTSFAESEVMAVLLELDPSEDPHSGAYAGYYSLVQAGLQEALTTHADHYKTNRAYGVNSYGKGEITLSQLAYVVGKEVLERSLRRYFQEWKFKHPTVTDFKRCVEKESGLELDWYFEYWINTNEVVDYAITLLWLVGITNAINFLDNMDGLSAGIAGVTSSFILLLALTNGQFLVATLSAALLGACLGFLRYNFPPARIFMGDVGSLFLGFLLAVLGIQLRFPDNSNFVTWMVPIFLFGLPIFDMTLVVFSRLRRGLSPNTAGRDHTSHRLVRLGFSPREAVLILYLFSGILGMMALYITQASLVEGYLVGGIAAILALVALVWLERKWKESEAT